MAAIEKRSRQDWQDLDKDHYLHPFTDHKELHKKRSRIITRGEGSYIFDADGNKILDGMSGLWCVNIGYGQQSLIDALTMSHFGCSGTTVRSHSASLTTT